jgi:toxin ParE1/3/4
VFRLSRHARSDLVEIAGSLGERNPSAADRVIEALSDTFRQLAQSPRMGTIRDDIRPNLRIFSPSRPAHNYVVLFYPIPEGVEIAGVYHAAQDWPAIFLRSDESGGESDATR